MGAQSNAAPVIIKRKKVVAGDGHHGGAWKVAYADFVTAMMAFFMLMWLLNATTEKQRKGLADYFSPSIPINRVSGGGDGSFGGDNVMSEQEMVHKGTGASHTQPTESQQARGASGLDDRGVPDEHKKDRLKEVEAELLGHSGESSVADELLQHIVTRVTDEGLVIDLHDLEDSHLFVGDTDRPTDLMLELASVVVNASRLVTNKVAVEGFVRSKPLVLANNPSWDLSAARSNRVRILLQGKGMDKQRIQRVAGHADREPVVDDPMSVRNNRIEVILLR